MIKIEDFEEYGLFPKDFRVDTYKINLIDGDFKRGVEVSIPQLEISIKCHSEISQIRNKAKCLNIIKLIIDHMIDNIGFNKEDFGKTIKINTYDNFR